MIFIRQPFMGICRRRVFDGARWDIDPSKYLRHLVKHTGASPACFVVAMIYLDRLIKRDSSIRITTRNMQRLLLVAAMVAVKFMDDISLLSNRDWYECVAMKSV
jgi:hypothetical protein